MAYDTFPANTMAYAYGPWHSVEIMASWGCVCVENIVNTLWSYILPLPDIYWCLCWIWGGALLKQSQIFNLPVAGSLIKLHRIINLDSIHNRPQISIDDILQCYHFGRVISKQAEWIQDTKQMQQQEKRAKERGEGYPTKYTTTYWVHSVEYSHYGEKCLGVVLTLRYLNSYSSVRIKMW